MRLRATRLTAIAHAARRLGLPGTLYTFGPAGMPGVTANLRRQGLGTMVGSDGLLRYGAHNLQPRSDDLSGAGWVKRGACTATASATAPPQALPGASVTRVASMNVAGVDDIYTDDFTVSSGAPWQLSFWIRKVTASGTMHAQSANSAANGNWRIDLSLIGSDWERITASHPAVTVLQAYNGSGNIYSGPLFYSVTGVISFDITRVRAQIGTTSNSADDALLKTTSAAVYLPRSPTYSSAGVLLGLLVEGQATNILGTWSDFTTTAGWTVSSLTTAASVVPGPSGAIEGTTISAGTNTSQGVYKSFTVSASTVYTLSMRVKLGTMAANEFMFALYDNSNAGFIASDIVPTQTLTADAWVRVIYTFTTPAGCTSLRVYPFRRSAALASTKTVHVSNGQLETGSVATSDIPNPGTGTMLRTADDFTISGVDFVDMFYDLGPNQILNGTFDAGLDNWTQVLGSMSNVGGRLRASRAGGSSGRIVSNAITCEVGRRYRVGLTAYVGTMGTANWYVGISATSQTGAIHTGSTTTDGPTSFTFVATQTTHWFACQAAQAGADGLYAEFDNVSVQEILNDRGAELVTNGHFTTDTAGWAPSNGGTIAAVGGELQVTASGSTNWPGASTTIPVQAGRTYVISWTGRRGAASQPDAAMAAVTGSTVHYNQTFSTSNVAARFETTFRATDSLLYLTFFAQGNPAAAGTVLVDNVSVREVLFEGTLAAEFQVSGFSTTETYPGVFQFLRASGDYFGVFMTMPSASTFGFTSRGGVGDYSLTGQITTGRNRVVARWSASGVSYSLNGGPVVTSVGAVPSVDSLRVGRFDIHLGGTIAGIRVVKNRAVSDGELRDLSKL